MRRSVWNLRVLPCKANCRIASFSSRQLLFLSLHDRVLLCKAKRQYLLTLQVSRYCLLSMHDRVAELRGENRWRVLLVCVLILPRWGGSRLYRVFTCPLTRGCSVLPWAESQHAFLADYEKILTSYRAITGDVGPQFNQAWANMFLVISLLFPRVRFTAAKTPSQRIFFQPLNILNVTDSIKG